MKIEKNVSLRKLNTFGIECHAEKLIRIEREEDLSILHQDGTLMVPEQLILGGGSNLLFTKHSLKQVVLIEIPGINESGSDSSSTLIRSGSGEIWDTLVQFAIKQGLGGIENLSIIPGKVGAAPIQNIGAYGVELAEVFESLTAFKLDSGKFVDFDQEKCKFGYRNSYFKSEGAGNYIICSITLRLNRFPEVNISYGTIGETLASMGNPVLSPAVVREAVIKIRNSKLPDPAEVGNAGSFFKNPVVSHDEFEKIKSKFEKIPGYQISDTEIKIPAGWLIERCGWKGKRIGNAGVHEKQALVLVNHDNATGKEIYQLAMEIQKSVLSEFGINLEPEVNII